MPLGIINLKKIIKFALDLTKNISTALADGKVSTAEIFGFLPELMQVPGIVKSWKDIAGEFKDLTPAERTELHAYVVANFDIPNDKVKLFIENALLNAISLITLVEEFKGLKEGTVFKSGPGSNPPPPPPKP